MTVSIETTQRAVEHKTLLAALRARRRKPLVPLLMVVRGKAHTLVTPISISRVERVLNNFVAGQCGALAIDLGDVSRQGVLLAERVCRHPAEGRALLDSKNKLGVRRARSVALATLVGIYGNVNQCLLAIKLRARRKGETSPVKVLEAFMKTEALA
jgi:hypothetical protein